MHSLAVMDDVATGFRFRVGPRYQGFPHAVLGSYVAGLAVGHLDGPVEVNLRSLPLIDRDFELTDEPDGSVVLRDGETIVLDAHERAFDVDVPAPPSLEEARQAAGRLLHDEAPHPFAGCFCCGPERDPGDGLRVHVGRTTPTGPLASAWTPHPAHGEDGELPPELVWSALDCPAIWAAWSDRVPAQPPEGRFTVLARQRLEQLAPVPVGEPSILTAWIAEREGRKTLCGTAIHAPNGELLVRADSLLVAIPTPKG
jgi:hypothetical protein